MISIMSQLSRYLRSGFHRPPEEIQVKPFLGPFWEVNADPFIERIVRKALRNHECYGNFTVWFPEKANVSEKDYGSAWLELREGSQLDVYINLSKESSAHEIRNSLETRMV